MRGRGAGHRRRLCARLARAARGRRRPRRRLLPRRRAARRGRSAGGAARSRRSASPWRRSAAWCRRAKPRARRPRRRSRRATSSRRSPACARRGPALALLVVGARDDVMLPPVAGLPVFGYVAIALLLIGTLLLLPRIAAFAPRARARAALGSGRARARAAARRAGAGRRQPRGDRRERLAHGVDGDHGRVVPRSRSTTGSCACCRPTCTCARARAGDSAFLAPDEQRAHRRAAPASRAVAFLRAQKRAARSRAAARRAARARPAARRSGARASAGRRPVRRARPAIRRPSWVSEAVADSTACGRARASQFRSAGALRTFVVAGIWRDYARQQGAIVIDRATLRRADRRRRANDAAIWLAPGATRGAIPRARSTPRFPARRASRLPRPARSARSRCASSTARSR